MTVYRTDRAAGAALGDAPLRREDARLLTGRGEFLDDLAFPGCAHAVFVRSPHPHARIERVRLGEARASDGVLAVLDAAAAADDGLEPLQPVFTSNPKSGEPFDFLPQPLLADGVVRHVGEAVVLVVAETLQAAVDAAGKVVVDYRPLPVVLTPAEARAPGAPELSASVPGNLYHAWTTGDAEAVDAAFEAAAHTVTCRLHNHRMITNPMEPRGAVASWDGERYHLTVSSQNIHGIRDVTAAALAVPPSRVRFVARDVGGGFGSKNFAYPEYPLVAWAARRTARPVKWIATRSETFLADHQGRDQHAVAGLALDAGGRFLALAIESDANIGAYMVGGMGSIACLLFAHLAGTVYDIPAVSLSISVVATNTTPVGVTRAPGFAEANYVMERLIDTAARECGFDRVTLRRRNLFAPGAMPIVNALGETVDSGDFPRVLDAVVRRAAIDGFGERRAASEARGLLRGLGISFHIKGTGGSPHENVDIRFENGGISLVTGTQSIGQGHETTMAQILAERLGIDDALVTLGQGDTDLIAFGGGHGSSRSTYMAGTAICRAVEKIIEAGCGEAAAVLEAAVDDIRYADGQFAIVGTDRAIGLLELAELMRRDDRPLDRGHAWTREHLTFPNGAHAVEIEIDPETGSIRLDRYTGVDDYGVLVNPTVAAGQVHGSIAQGLGQALLEQALYDPDSGQQVTGSLMDYPLPRADDLVGFDLDYSHTRCITNPLGVKGCGEAAVCVGLPAIHNALLDALAGTGVTEFEGAATPWRVWRALRGAAPP